MKILLQILFILVLQSCNSRNPKDFIYSKNQDWTIEFQNNSLPSKTLYKDKIYCSSIRVGEQNYLYCLNLKTGKVDWATKVKDWATIPPIVNDSLIYYSSYTGDLYRLNSEGKIIWEKETNGVFKKIAINPWNGNLMVTTTTNGLFEYNATNGQITKNFASNSFAITYPVFFQKCLFIAGVKPENDTNNLRGNLLVCYNSERNKEFEIEIGKVESIHLNNHQLFYFHIDSSKLFCFDLKDKKIVWESNKLKDVVSNNIYITDDNVYCYGLNLNEVYELDKKSGNIIRIVSYNKLLAEKKITQNIYSYRLNSENKIKEIRIIDSLESPIPVNSELNIYIK